MTDPAGTAVAIVLAAGLGERLGTREPKAFLDLGGGSMMERSAAVAAACSGVSSLVVVVPPGQEGAAGRMLRLDLPAAVVAGGATRHESVLAALSVVAQDAGAIVCHDAARPFASPDLFGAVLEALADADGAVPVVGIPDTVKRVRGGVVVATEPREELFLAQTPQAFRAPALRDAHARASRARLEFTDDAAAMEWAGYRVRVVPGEAGNFKVTTGEDLARARSVVAMDGSGA